MPWAPPCWGHATQLEIIVAHPFPKPLSVQKLLRYVGVFVGLQHVLTLTGPCKSYLTLFCEVFGKVTFGRDSFLVDYTLIIEPSPPQLPNENRNWKLLCECLMTFFVCRKKHILYKDSLQHATSGFITVGELGTTRNGYHYEAWHTILNRLGLENGRKHMETLHIYQQFC